MAALETIKQQHGYKLRGIEPPDLAYYPPETRKLYWTWVVELGIKAKAKDILAGLDKDGRPLRPIAEKTRQHRRSAMTPSGKGDPAAPPLIPGWQKSRTYSLLNGRAFTSHAEFFWRYDAWTGDSWAAVLSYQAAKGRDVFGLSPAGTAWVKVHSWAKWEQYKAGTLRQPLARAASSARRAAVPRIGRYDRSTAVAGMSLGVETGTPGGASAARWTGGMTPEEWAAYFRGTASAKLPGRPARPAAKSPISGPGYNRIIKATWGQGPGRGGSGLAAPATPRPGPRKPPKPPGTNRIAGKLPTRKPTLPKPPAPPPKNPPEPIAAKPIDFTMAVLRAVQLAPGVGGQWNDRAWIHEVWAAYQTIPGVERIPLSTFKARIIVDMTLRGRLVRADLTSAFDFDTLKQAEAKLMLGGFEAATWHFFRK